MIYPLKDSILIKIYKCPVCEKIYRDLNMGDHAFKSCGCAAIHLPGSCCHSGEQEISQKKLKKIEESIDG